jgi:hypothetical protein
VEKMMKVLMLVLTTASLAAAPTAAGAQAQSTTATTAAPDPNEVVCEREEVTGSRLAHRKVCMTRSQWQDTRRQDRTAVEKVQMNRGMISEGAKPGG